MNNYLEYYNDNPLIELRKLTNRRKTIATRLFDSYSERVHSTGHRAVECDTLIKFIEQVNKLNKFGFKTTLIDYLYRAIALALKNNPIFNSIFDGNEIHIFKKINLGIAIDTKRGLVVPVLKDCLGLSFADFVIKRRALIDSAMNFNNSYEDLTGGTFTVSNLGLQGIDNFTMIINPPQIAILGIGRLFYTNISWSQNEKPKIKALLPLSLTHDHRITDGADVAKFMETIQAFLLQPEEIIKF